MRKLSAVLVFLSLFLFTSPVTAIVDPHSSANNKFGIHIIDEGDLETAALLVNSSGGEWGYVTMVITEEDRNIDKWTNTFRRMQRLKLIPVIRIATKLTVDYWEAPEMEEAHKWANFLNALPWPVKNRYIIIYNEPNHAKEWGGRLDPENYAEILTVFSSSLKAASEDFFILPAGLDASAPNSAITMDEQHFLNRMLASNPQLLTTIDGWTSHSYPNPGFSGSVKARGRGTLTSYLWEIDLLKTHGLEKNLPVFITETGWAHNMDSGYRGLTPDVVAQNYVDAHSEVWYDQQIVMISPFLLNYQSYPFDIFSWQKTGTGEFYPQYDAYRSIVKEKGEPAINTPTPTPTKIHFPLRLVKGIEAANTQSANFKDQNFLSSIFSFIKKIIPDFS